jgi:hypothetical protein
MSPVPRHRHDEAGSTSVFAICVAAVLMLLAGLCIDGGRVLNTRATLADTAEQAARAGAQRVQVGELRRSGAVVFDAREARAAANAYLSSAGGTGAAGSDVTTTGNTVTVTMEEDVPTFMLSLVGLSTVHITVSGSAEAETGSN